MLLFFFCCHFQDSFFLFFLIFIFILFYLIFFFFNFFRGWWIVGLFILEIQALQILLSCLSVPSSHTPHFTLYSCSTSHIKPRHRAKRRFFRAEHFSLSIIYIYSLGYLLCFVNNLSRAGPAFIILFISFQAAHLKRATWINSRLSTNSIGESVFFFQVKRQPVCFPQI